MPEFISIAVSGAPVIVPIPQVPETVFATGGRVRWAMTGTATETVNTVGGTHDGLDGTFDAAASILNGGLAYSVGYAVSTPGVASIASVKLRVRYYADATVTTSALLYELSAAYDNTTIAQSTVAPTPYVWSWFEYSMTTNPSTGLAWANSAAVSAKLWGFTFNAGGVVGFNTFYVSEIELVVIPT